MGLVVGACISVGGLGLALFCFWKNKRKTGENEDDPIINDCSMDDFEKVTGPKKFS